MIRKTKTSKVDMIITADWHLMEQERNPPCRLDLHWNAQWDKVNQIKELQQKYNCCIFNAGDIFEYWKASPGLINQCIKNIPKDMFSIAGNHDEPQHNYNLIKKSAWWTLVKCKTINFMKHGHWGLPLETIKELTFFNKKIILVHMMVWKGKRPWPGCVDPEVNELFNIFPNADLIITGHNHKTFTVKKGNKLLINPGSLTRHKADQVNHKPCVFLWNAKTNTCKIHYLKIKKNVISREHIDIKKQKEERGLAFIEKLQTNWDMSLSFKDNLEIFFQQNKVADKIKQLIYKWYGV